MSDTKATYRIERSGSLVDAVNAACAAQGSFRFAMGAAHANYNGHQVGVDWNDYRGYWIAEYFYGGRNVLARSSSFAQALDAAFEEFNKGASFASINAQPKTQEEIDLCIARGMTLRDPDWWKKPSDPTSLFSYIGDAIRNEKTFGVPATSLLVQSKTVAEYQAKLDAYFGRNRESALAHAQAASDAFTKSIEGL